MEKHQFRYAMTYIQPFIHFLILDLQCHFCVGGIGTECDDASFDPSNMPTQDCSAAGFEDNCVVSYPQTLSKGTILKKFKSLIKLLYYHLKTDLFISFIEDNII